MFSFCTAFCLAERRGIVEDGKPTERPRLELGAQGMGKGVAWLRRPVVTGVTDSQGSGEHTRRETAHCWRYQRADGTTLDGDGQRKGQELSRGFLHREA